MKPSLLLLSTFVLLSSSLGCSSPPEEEEPKIPVVPNDTVPMLAMGGDAVESACVLGKDGIVKCWGNNSANQLGKAAADFDSHTSPEPIAVSIQAKSIDFGVFHACAAQTDGAVTCWGGDYVAGMMGEGTGALKIPPTTLPALADVQSVALGAYFGCALHNDGTVSCWGDNRYGQLGLGTVDEMPHDGAAKVPGLANIKALAAGATHICALAQSGTVSCWGSGSHGQLGDGTAMDHAAPTAIPNLAGVEEIAAGSAFSCARAAEGEILCWGTNTIGQVGDGSGQDQKSPVALPLPAPTISLAAGESHTCAATQYGEVFCWGAGEAGQLGQTSLGQCKGQDVTYGCYQTPVNARLSRVFRVMVGGGSTCGATETGTIQCVGRIGEISGDCKGMECAKSFLLSL